MRSVSAAIVAIICWAGLAIQFRATHANQHDVVATLWVLARFFTVITNLIVAVAMTLEAIGRRLPPVLLGGATIAILLVGIVYMTLLRGLIDLSGGALLADTLLHKASPIAMALWWLVLAPHRLLGWAAPAWWSLYPLTYFAYAVVRGQADGKYPYPFMDVSVIGWSQMLLNAGGIALAFLLAGLVLVALDRMLPARAKPER